MVVPEALRVTRLRPGRRFTNLGRMCSEVGWKHWDTIKTLEAKRKTKSSAFWAKKKEVIQVTMDSLSICHFDLYLLDIVGCSCGGRLPSRLPATPRSRRSRRFWTWWRSLHLSTKRRAPAELGRGARAWAGGGAKSTFYMLNVWQRNATRKSSYRPITSNCIPSIYRHPTGSKRFGSPIVAYMRWATKLHSALRHCLSLRGWRGMMKYCSFTISLQLIQANRFTSCTWRAVLASVA